jgi:hypothetical protein
MLSARTHVGNARTLMGQCDRHLRNPHEWRALALRRRERVPGSTPVWLLHRMPITSRRPVADRQTTAVTRPQASSRASMRGGGQGVQGGDVHDGNTRSTLGAPTACTRHPDGLPVGVPVSRPERFPGKLQIRTFSRHVHAYRGISRGHANRRTLHDRRLAVELDATPQRAHHDLHCLPGAGSDDERAGYACRGYKGAGACARPAQPVV